MNFEMLEDRRLLAAALAPPPGFSFPAPAGGSDQLTATVVIVNLPDPSAATGENLVVDPVASPPAQNIFVAPDPLGEWDALGVLLAPISEGNAGDVSPTPAELGNGTTGDPASATPPSKVPGLRPVEGVSLTGQEEPISPPDDGAPTPPAGDLRDPGATQALSGQVVGQDLPAGSVKKLPGTSGDSTPPGYGDTSDPGSGGDQGGSGDAQDQADGQGSDGGDGGQDRQTGRQLGAPDQVQSDPTPSETYHRHRHHGDRSDNSAGDGTGGGDPGFNRGTRGDSSDGQGAGAQGETDGQNLADDGSSAPDLGADNRGNNPDPGTADPGPGSADDGVFPEVGPSQEPVRHGRRGHHGRSRPAAAPSVETGTSDDSGAVAELVPAVDIATYDPGSAALDGSGGDLSQWNFTTEIDDLDSAPAGALVASPSPDGKPHESGGKAGENWTYLAVGFVERGATLSPLAGTSVTAAAVFPGDAALEAFEAVHNVPAPGGGVRPEALGVKRVFVRPAAVGQGWQVNHAQRLSASSPVALAATPLQPEADRFAGRSWVAAASAPAGQAVPEMVVASAAPLFAQTLHTGHSDSGSAGRLEKYGWWGLVGQFILAPQFPNNNQPTIMLAVADEASRDALNVALVKANFLVLTAATARDAINLLRTPLAPVDAALLDDRLPDVRGVDLCTRLRELFPKLPVMVCAEEAGQDDMAQLHRLNVQKVFLKPVPISEFLAVIQKMFP